MAIQQLPPQQGAPMQQPMPQQSPPQGMGNPQQGGNQPPMPPQGQPQMGGQPTNEQIQKELDNLFMFVLLKRIESMSEEELAALDSIITPETIGVLVKLLPELIPVFSNASSIRDSQEDMAEGEDDSEEGSDDQPMSENPLSGNYVDEERKQMMMNRNPAISQGLVR